MAGAAEPQHLRYLCSGRAFIAGMLPEMKGLRYCKLLTTVPLPTHPVSPYT